MDAPVSATGPILVAVDFEPCSRAALAWAAGQALALGCRLLVVHVVHEPEDDPGYYRRFADPADGDSAPLDVPARRALDALLAEARATIPALRALHEVPARLVTGLPATRILDVAEESGATHIVVGSRGRTGLRHLIGGSTAARVVQLSPLPVTVVKAGNDEASGGAEDASA